MVLATMDNIAANQQAFLDHVNSVGTCRRGVCGRRTMGKLSAAWPLCTIPTLKVDNAEDWTVSTHQQYAPVGSAGSWYYFSALSVSVQTLVDVFLSLAFVTLFDSTDSRVPFPRWCVLVYPQEVVFGRCWKYGKVMFCGHAMRIARLILHQLLSRFGAGTGHQYWILCIGHFGRSCHCGTKV